MKKMKWVGFVMLVSVSLLTGCNQGEEQGNILTEEQISMGASDSEYLIESAEALITRLSEGKYEEATEKFNNEMLEQLTPEILEETWALVQGQLGTFIDYEFHSLVEANGMQVVLISGIFNEADVVFQIAFDENQKIAGFIM